MTQNPLGAGKARLRPCEAPVRPWSNHPPWPGKGPVGPLGAGFGGRQRAWGSWQNRWGGNRRPCRSLRPWQELRETQNLSRSRQETSGIKAFSRTLVRGKQSARLSCLALVLGASPPCPRSLQTRCKKRKETTHGKTKKTKSNFDRPAHGTGEGADSDPGQESPAQRHRLPGGPVLGDTHLPGAGHPSPAGGAETHGQQREPYQAQAPSTVRGSIEW